MDIPHPVPHPSKLVSNFIKQVKTGYRTVPGYLNKTLYLLKLQLLQLPPVVAFFLRWVVGSNKTHTNSGHDQGCPYLCGAGGPGSDLRLHQLGLKKQCASRSGDRVDARPDVGNVLWCAGD